MRRPLSAEISFPKKRARQAILEMESGARVNPVIFRPGAKRGKVRVALMRQPAAGGKEKVGIEAGHSLFFFPFRLVAEHPLREVDRLTESRDGIDELDGVVGVLEIESKNRFLSEKKARKKGNVAADRSLEIRSSIGSMGLMQNRADGGKSSVEIQERFGREKRGVLKRVALQAVGMKIRKVLVRENMVEAKDLTPAKACKRSFSSGCEDAGVIDAGVDFDLPPVLHFQSEVGRVDFCARAIRDIDSPKGVAIHGADVFRHLLQRNGIAGLRVKGFCEALRLRPAVAHNIDLPEAALFHYNLQNPRCLVLIGDGDGYERAVILLVMAIDLLADLSDIFLIPLFAQIKRFQLFDKAAERARQIKSFDLDSFDCLQPLFAQLRAGENHPADWISQAKDRQQQNHK